MRKQWVSVVAAVVLGAAPLIAQGAAAQTAPAMSAADVAKVEVAAALQDYMKAFSAQDSKAVARVIYSQPGITLSEQGVTLINPAQQELTNAAFIKKLVETGWVRTETPQVTVCVLNPTAAIGSGKYIRYRKDGTVHSQGGGVNFYSKTSQGWKMVTRINTLPEKVVTCEDGTQPSNGGAPDVARAKEEVIAAVRNYMTQYSARNAKAVAHEVYSKPGLQFGANGVSLIDPDRQEASTAARIKQMVAQGWDKSTFPNPSACILNPYAAIVSGAFHRHDKAGKVIYEGGETDLFVKTPQGWKMISLIGTAPSKVVTCND